MVKQLEFAFPWLLRLALSRQGKVLRPVFLLAGAPGEGLTSAPGRESEIGYVVFLFSVPFAL